MRLKRCASQAAHLAGDHRAPSGADGLNSEPDSRAALLRLMDRLRDHPADAAVYWLSSIGTFSLLSRDDPGADRWVTVAPALPSFFVIDYLMPAESAPWPGARVHGVAESEEEAFRMMLIAMERSGAWLPQDDV